MTINKSELLKPNKPERAGGIRSENINKRGHLGKIGLILPLIMAASVLCTGCRLSGEVEEITVLGEVTSSLGKPTSAPGLELTDQSNAANPKEGASTGMERATFIICEIKGHIGKPGVYDLADGSRVSDLIIRSGGVLATGSLELVNQARKLQDGEVVIIPAKGVTKEQYDEMAVSNPDPPQTAPGKQSTGNTGTALVNINTANEAELDTIPGVGPATAKNIIDYRTNIGPFAAIEDLKKVDRIGDKTFEKLKQYITVGH